MIRCCDKKSESVHVGQLRRTERHLVSVVAGRFVDENI